MKNSHSIQAIFAKALAAIATNNTPFPVADKVVLSLDPSTPGHQEQIDEVTHWARSSDRVGRSRRVVCTERGEVTFEFEKTVDAVECSLRFV